MFRTLFRATALAVLLLTSSALAAQGQDQIDLSQVEVHHSPANVASWPVTVKITRITMRPNGVQPDGVAFDFTQMNWPEYTPPGWTGSLQYTVWPVVRINGAWHTAGIMQMWKGRASTGAPLLTSFAKDWVYSDRWGPLVGHQPVVGEQMGFFLTAGDARDQTGVTSVAERSNVVLVNVPANDSGDFEFPDATPPPPPVATPPPAGTPPVATPAPSTPPPGSSDQLAELNAKLDALKQQQAEDTAKILAAIADLKQDIHDGIRRIGDTYLPLLFNFISRPAPAPAK
jgi:hypothetical protein